MYDKQALAEELRICVQQHDTLRKQAQSLHAQAEAAMKHLSLMRNVERILVALSTGSKAQQEDAIAELRRMAAHKKASEPKEKVFPARYGSWLYTICQYPTLSIHNWPMHESDLFWTNSGYRINEAGLALLDYLDKQNNSSTGGNHG